MHLHTKLVVKCIPPQAGSVGLHMFGQKFENGLEENIHDGIRKQISKTSFKEVK
jgi:hypothetical protein